LSPYAVGRTPALTGARVVAGQAQVEPDGALHRLDHFQDGRGTVQFLQLKPAGVAAMGDHQAGTCQILQYLTEELLGTFGDRREFRTAYPRARRKAGQMNHDPDGIVSGSG